MYRTIIVYESIEDAPANRGVLVDDINQWRSKGDAMRHAKEECRWQGTISALVLDKYGQVVANLTGEFR